MNEIIRVPQGIKVFGSSIIRIAPDTATINVAVSRVEKQPKGAFAKAHAGAQAVHEYLKKAAIDDVGSSRITLSQEFRHEHGESRFVGYKAMIGYSIVLRELDRVETLLVGLIDAGANELTSVTFQTSRLKKVREEARRRALQAARQKAELYAAAANVSVGDVVAIEDENPERLSRRYEGHVANPEVEVDDPGELKALDPGSIAVGGAVSVVYEIGADD